MAPRDFTRFPEERGMLVFPISLSRISNSQSAKMYWEYVQLLEKKIVKTEGIGVTFVYGDYLYFLTEKDSPATLRHRYLNLMAQHKNEFVGILTRDINWVCDYFSFQTYGQVRLDTSKVYNKYFEKLLKIYSEDPELQECVATDVGNREHTKEHINFVLEETLLFHLASKGVFSYPNQIINHREEWVLHCYPGKPMVTEFYLYRKNPFKLGNPKNKFENHFYDLEERKLYDLSAF